MNDEKKKEKIIQEQSQTICGMKCELQEKTQELNKAECEMLQAENEIDDIRNELATKREQLQKEIIEKNKLNAKLSVINPTERISLVKSILSRNWRRIRMI